MTVPTILGALFLGVLVTVVIIGVLFFAEDE